MKKTKETQNLAQDIADLKQLSQWFEANPNFNLEEGLVNVKEAARLYKQIKNQLADLENEFSHVKKDLEQDVV